MLGSLIAIVGGGLYMAVPSMIGESTYNKSPNQRVTPLVGVQKDIVDFHLGIFNECCASRNWTAQPPAVPCTPTWIDGTDCPDLREPDKTLVQTYIPSARVLLCSCASSAGKLAAFEAAIRDTGFCAKAATATINAVGLVLPSPIPGNLKLQTLTSLRPEFNIPYSTVKLVGWYEIPATNPDQTNPGTTPFGCGLGYQKGLQFMVDIWFAQNAAPASTAALALGVCNWLVMIIAIAIAKMQDAEDIEESKGQNKWDQIQDIPSSFAMTAPAGHHNPVIHDSGGLVVIQNPQQFAQSYNLSSSTHSSVASSASAQNSLAKDQLAQRLGAFYVKYEPGKDLNDVDDVAKWAMLNGVQALNAKLKSKYGADLDSTVSQVGGMAAKALKADLDL